MQQKPILVLVAYAILVGCVAGIAAWAFRLLIGLVHNILFLGSFSTSYDANLHTAAGPWGWGVIFVPVVGAILVAWLVSTFAPEAKGHGVPEVMHAIHNQDGIIRPQVAIVKSLASAISIGSGASVGREGPIVQIGSAFGSILGQIVPMTAADRSLLIAAGAGAGIAATFNAPLGGLIFAVELLMLVVNVHSLLVVAIATVTATIIGRLLIGTQPSFDIPALQNALPEVIGLPTLAALLAMAVLGGALAALFIRALYKAEDLFDEMPGNYYTRHMLGMICVGLMLYAMLRFTGQYYIEGVGYATIEDIFNGVLTAPGFLMLLCGLKLLSTCLSLGSGASGGVFSPALFMGATLGAAFAHVYGYIADVQPETVVLFAAAGMVAMIAGTTGAILTALVMMVELTADYGLILPLMMVAAVSGVMRHVLCNETIYTLKLIRRGETVPLGLQTALHKIDDQR